MIKIFHRPKKKRDITKLNYGMIHSVFGYPDGVSIVMKQIDGVLIQDLKIPRKNIFYLVGKSKIKSRNISEKEPIWEGYKINQKMLEDYQVGYGGEENEKIEEGILFAKKSIKEFVKKNKIDVLIVHNSSHPINFISSIALSRYYRDEIKKGNKTPKYILWWHDSHLERDFYLNPPKDVGEYLLEGVPGKYVDYILFINSLQFKEAKKYFKRIDKKNPGFYEKVKMNHDLVYNTTETFINKFRDLQGTRFNEIVEKFLKEFKIGEVLKKQRLSLKDTLFCLQHTRIVSRKRIDFALRYCYELLDQLKKKDLYKGMYFLVSGHTADKTKKKLLKLNRELKKEYNTKKLFLVFAEDHYEKTNIHFEEYPKIFAKLGGISTYFSEIEGFGNNLLEVLSSGLIPIVYTYPVFKKDISKYKFKIIALDNFEINQEKIDETIDVLKSKKKRKEWVDQNIRILKKHFPHKTIAVKIRNAILSGKKKH
jgi:mannosylglucosylglycerate synthase